MRAGATLPVPGMLILSVLLAVSSALAFASSTVLQQSTARAAALRHGNNGRSWLPVLAFLGQLVRHPVWLIGYVLNGLGFLLHVVALHVGAIAVVQAVLVIQLLFALLISAARHHQWPTPRDWVGAVAVCAGIAIIALLRGDVDQRVASRFAVAAFAVVVVIALGVLLTVARSIRHRAQPRTALVAVGAGLCFCATAVMVVVVTQDIAERGVSAILNWPLVGIIVAAAVGTLLVQDAFASGSLPTAVTAMTIADPMCAGVVGAFLFDEAPPAGLELWLGMPAAATLIVVGVILLATSTTLHDERHLYGGEVPVPSPPEQARRQRRLAADQT